MCVPEKFVGRALEVLRARPRPIGIGRAISPRLGGIIVKTRGFEESEIYPEI